MYTLMDERFYEPLELRYRPIPEYNSIVNDLLQVAGNGWSSTRDGFWFFVHPGNGYVLPIQGWKIHVSANIGNAASVLRRAARIALAHDVSFKFALDRNVLAAMSSKRWARGGSGKFITMYPPDPDRFKSLLEELYAELQGEEGPYILSDKRYKDCRVLYYRFGGMQRTSRLDVTGEKVLVMISPEGEAVPDVRTPYFAPPSWASDPFPTEASSNGGGIVLNNRFRVKKAIAISNSGGVYLADDQETGREVIVKEARAHTAMDDRGNDAIKLLKNEQELLELLKDTRIAPQPVDAFYGWENFFLVEEYLEGANIREIMLTQSPLMLVRPSLEDSQRYFETYRRILKGFVHAVDALHQKGLVFGDLNATNIRIDPETYAVQLIDFESAFKFDSGQATYLFTPGFKSAASIRQNTQSFADDLFALAANMLYMLFPIAALATLKPDLFDTVVKTVLHDVGWSETELYNVINGLAKNELTPGRACELLDQPAQIVAPQFADDIDADDTEEIAEELGRFILANIRSDRDDSLFPVDPFVHRTNSLSLGFGASGVLYTLRKCGFEIPKSATDWLEQKLDKAAREPLSPGLLTGASGIAWTLWELGFEDRATHLMRRANQSSLLKAHHSYLHGMAGIGVANLHFYVRTSNPDYLAVAKDLGDSLLASARENERGLYWEADGLLHLGFGYGQSGVALFLLRLAQLTGAEHYRTAGRRALEFDLSHGEEREKGVLSFPRTPGDPTALPYLEEGSAGIARVAIRYGLWDERLEMILAEAHRKYSGYAGLLYGLSSLVDVLTDAYLFSKDVNYLEMAKRPLTGIRDLYLIKQTHGLATPGDNLFRISCDYATGVAGVMRTLHRFTHHEKADFVLDEL
jgi:serine/threonine protein kinase